MARTQHPGIYQIGRVQLTPDGATLISGWGITVCAAGCPCHRHPANGHLYLVEDQDAGLLGLRSFVDNACRCCTPWHADELADVLRDLAVAEALPVQAKGESCPPPAA